MSELISTSPHWLFWGRSSILRDDDPSLEGRTRTLSTLLSLVCWDPQVSRHRDWWRQRRSVTSLYISQSVGEFTLESVNAGQDPCYACWPSLHTTDSATDVWFSLIWMISCELWVLLSQTHWVTSYCTIVLLITECRVVINSDKWICFCQSFMMNLLITVLSIWS